ncbi:MAG: hypothetical protein HY788_01705 [Deltaproteobacteria bacterium]|nr:hypothetical protein [Deltaproteobacteria bacterium]
MAVSSPEQTKSSIFDVTDVVSLSGNNKGKPRQELIEETLLVSLMDRMQKLEGVVERLEKMEVTPHTVAPSPMSQISVDDTARSSDGPAASSRFTPVTMIETPESSPAKSPQAQADIIPSKYFGAASFIDPGIGRNLDVVVGEAPLGGPGAAASAAGVGAVAGIASGPGLGAIKA